MPYNLKKYKSGYKVCKKNSSKCFSKKPLTKQKAENQMKALYANESMHEGLNLKNIGNNLRFKSVIENPVKNIILVTYKIKSEINADIRIAYISGKTLKDINYLYFEIHDHNDPKGKPKPFETPESEFAIKELKTYNLESNDILMANKDGYNKIKEYFLKSDDSKYFEENLQFNDLCNELFKSS